MQHMTITDQEGKKTMVHAIARLKPAVAAPGMRIAFESPFNH